MHLSALGLGLLLAAVASFGLSGCDSDDENGSDSMRGGLAGAAGGFFGGGNDEAGGGEGEGRATDPSRVSAAVCSNACTGLVNCLLSICEAANYTVDSLLCGLRPAPA